MDRQNPRTNGNRKAIQTKSHTDAYSYTLTKREKRGKNEYIFAPKVHLLNLRWFVFYSGTPQLQGTSSWLWRFNLLLLSLLGEISLSLICSHSSWGSALDLGLPLRVGWLKASVLHSDRTGLKEQLIWGLWLTQAWRREGYGMQGKPVVAEASLTLHQPEACSVFSWGSCPCITGPWQWRAAQAPRRGGVDSDLCLHTGFLVAAVQR